MADERPTVEVRAHNFHLPFDISKTFFCRLMYGPKINYEEDDIKKGSLPEWKLNPKVNYDDDDGDD